MSPSITKSERPLVDTSGIAVTEKFQLISHLTNSSHALDRSLWGAVFCLMFDSPGLWDEEINNETTHAEKQNEHMKEIEEMKENPASFEQNKPERRQTWFCKELPGRAEVSSQHSYTSKLKTDGLDLSKQHTQIAPAHDI